MTRKKLTEQPGLTDKNFKKLSIQVSLDGLSFCVADRVDHTLLLADSTTFGQEHNPVTLLRETKKLFEAHGLAHQDFEEVVLVHQNTLFGLVPKALFDPDHLTGYLALNTKVLSNDVLAFDEIKNQEMINVYVPYMNINNYLYEQFGTFTYMHCGTVLVQAILQNHGAHQQPACYVHVGKRQMDVLVVKQKRLLLYNSFKWNTPEEFTYYLLFVLEQLELDTETTATHLFGAVSKDNDAFLMCHTYIRDVQVFEPKVPDHIVLGSTPAKSLDFAVLNTL
ncbi:DUF3822 family protein [Maribacter sp. 2307ULW6-5]|uniref:DUF3822 family protein n=1 Tax=Maribacter sp. 2307ULW6-5 TaxID=3386275 RepID=UPI0039BCFD59